MFTLYWIFKKNLWVYIQDYHNETRINYNATLFSLTIYLETFQTYIKVARIVQLVILGESYIRSTSFT